jgi:hypothetical protein
VPATVGIFRCAGGGSERTERAGSGAGISGEGEHGSTLKMTENSRLAARLSEKQKQPDFVLSFEEIEEISALRCARAQRAEWWDDDT